MYQRIFVIGDHLNNGDIKLKHHWSTWSHAFNLLLDSISAPLALEPLTLNQKVDHNGNSTTVMDK